MWYIPRMISFNDFKKLDIRIATIRSVGLVEGSKKLYALILSVGEEQRTIVSGIAEYYSPEDLVGKQVPVLLNLEPKEMLGIVSNGMILAADVGGKPVLLHPDKAVPDGSVVR